MRNNAEDRANRFYNTVGWKTESGATEDARRWEDLRENAREYVSKCRLRVLRHIPDNGDNILDMASGPIQYEEYLEYSKNYNKRYCVDLSSKALELAKNKIGDHGIYLHGSFFDIPLEHNYFDCSISLHTIYHIDKYKQEEAVRKLIDVTKPGKPIIIVYGNPNTLNSSLKPRIILRIIKKTKKILKKISNKKTIKDNNSLYYHLYPINWWYKFSDIADLQIYPWRSFSSETQKKLFPDNKLGNLMFSYLFKLEERFPKFFVNHFQYPMIVLIKK